MKLRYYHIDRGYQHKLRNHANALMKLGRPWTMQVESNFEREQVDTTDRIVEVLYFLVPDL